MFFVVLVCTISDKTGKQPDTFVHKCAQMCTNVHFSVFENMKFHVFSCFFMFFQLQIDNLQEYSNHFQMVWPSRFGAQNVH